MIKYEKIMLIIATSKQLILYFTIEVFLILVDKYFLFLPIVINTQIRNILRTTRHTEKKNAYTDKKIISYKISLNLIKSLGYFMTSYEKH